VASYNAERPHQALGMATPASRFLTAVPGRPADTSAVTERLGDGWISRRVTTNGIISVAWQQVSCGKHRAGVDVHVDDQTMQIWDGEELIKTVLRTAFGEVRKKHAARARAS
jgi:hypothetical protein